VMRTHPSSTRSAEVTTGEIILYKITTRLMGKIWGSVASGFRGAHFRALQRDEHGRVSHLIVPTLRLETGNSEKIKWTLRIGGGGASPFWR